MLMRSPPHPALSFIPFGKGQLWVDPPSTPLALVVHLLARERRKSANSTSTVVGYLSPHFPHFSPLLSNFSEFQIQSSQLMESPQPLRALAPTWAKSGGQKLSSPSNFQARPLHLLHPASTVAMGTWALNCFACLEAEDFSFDAHSPEIDWPPIRFLLFSWGIFLFASCLRLARSASESNIWLNFAKKYYLYLDLFPKRSKVAYENAPKMWRAKNWCKRKMNQRINKSNLEKDSKREWMSAMPRSQMRVLNYGF